MGWGRIAQAERSSGAQKQRGEKVRLDERVVHVLELPGVEQKESGSMRQGLED